MKSLAILSAASALALAGTVAYAQPAPPPAGGPGGQGQRPQMSREDFESLTDARIASIQAGLKLTPDQQKLWGPVEQALRAQAATRTQMIEEFRQRRSRNERPDVMQRLEQGAAMATKRAENLNALSTAMKPLWASLDDRQKRLLPILMREGRPGRGAWRGHHGQRGQMGMMQRGPGAMQPGGGQPAQPPKQP
ncbi:Spy/CpxP family protein refolding chaperone [Microvirga puerhi]|uniref:Spy/CpxP family protein refolding chaperone n=1 Tax=Microvirga puerhi TaxID=2876078 RepID=A0ABS7VJX9_9HYPH|nr:Spy/CpxP family protein refolding chaperone [Microvirga puerhi]MBZ6075445.1 Spy/CpxP family protein refolding chaperone [Microvirga puerhi]